MHMPFFGRFFQSFHFSTSLHEINFATLHPLLSSHLMMLPKVIGRTDSWLDSYQKPSCHLLIINGTLDRRILKDYHDPHLGSPGLGFFDTEEWAQTGKKN